MDAYMFESLKYARRQAYRYGRQIALMNDVQSMSFNKHLAAWSDFLNQFKSLEEADTIITYLTSMFDRGREGDGAIDVAMNFIITGDDHGSF